MIIKRNTMYDLGFKTMGLDWGKNEVVTTYTKYYHKDLYLLIADGYTSSLYAFKFDHKDEMQEFMDGKFGITKDPYSGGRKGITGYPMKYKPSVSINEKLNIHRITRTKHLTDGIKLFENTFIKKQKAWPQ